MLLSKMSKYGMYLPGIIHNINNPMTSLSGNLQLLSLHHPEIKKLPELHGLVQKVTEQLSLLGAINGQDMYSLSDVCSITRILDQLQFFLQADSIFKHSVIQNIQDTPDYSLSINPGAFFMVLLHLFQNALDAILEKKEGQGEIHFSYKQQDSVVVFTLNDNGTGIPEKIRDKVFDPGFTTKDSENEGYRFPRPGYGLTLAREILIQHGGDISLAGEKDEGTIITFSVPIKK